MNEDWKTEYGGYPGGTEPRHERPAPPPKSSRPPADPPVDWSEAELGQLSLASLEKLIASAEAGDATAVAAFRQFLDKGGSAAWREVGDLADVAEKMLVAKVFTGAKAPALAARRRFQDLRTELAEDHATPLEKLAIDRVILASMFACAVDFLVAAEGPGGLTSEKRIQAQALAEKRVHAAMKSLQTAREISRAAVAGPLRLFGSRTRSTEPPLRAATG
ncbi:MAG: hypothetical protein H0T51_04625 [Pirellulales bacterium]|nr:hypothetical protein [Pirellulales bacterium]